MKYACFSDRIHYYLYHYKDTPVMNGGVFLNTVSTRDSQICYSERSVSHLVFKGPV